MIRAIVILMALILFLFSATPGGSRTPVDGETAVQDGIDSTETPSAPEAVRLTPAATTAQEDAAATIAPTATATPEPTAAPVTQERSTQGGENETSMMSDF